MVVEKVHPTRRGRCKRRSHVDAAIRISAILIVALSCVSLSGRTARAGDLRCPDANVVIHSPDLADARTACEGAADALRFLGEQGLQTEGEIELRIVEQLPDTSRGFTSTHSVSGVYIPAERRAYILVFSKFAEQSSLLDLPIDRVLYKSLATHEIAHVVAALNFAIPKPRIEAQEYIVYVTMLATMSEGYRKYLLNKFPSDGFDAEAHFNTNIYLLDPLQFGVQAYRHFLMPGNGQAFFGRILAGRALIEGNGP